jgi:hypothetical protein
VRLTASFTDKLQVPSPSYATGQTIGGYSIAETFQSRQSKGLGITFIIIAVVAIIFDIIVIAGKDPFAQLGRGFQSSVLVNALHSISQTIWCACFETRKVTVPET